MSKQKEWKAIVNRPGIEKRKGENMFTEYIDKKIQDLKNEEMILEKEERKDEANFIKIKINICEICKILYYVSKKEANAQNVKGFYLQKIEKLSLEWKASKEKAKEHNDIEKMTIEELKLEVLKDMKQKYMEFNEN